jgi:3-oxoacyl-[acyl-carrier protein] reductase
MSNRVGVVTGGTRGIGFHIARALVKRGCSVGVTYMSNDSSARDAEDQLRQLADKDQDVRILKGDAGNPDTVAEHAAVIREEMGRVNVLVNNAGIMPQQNFTNITTDLWDETLRINLSSAFYWSKQVVPDMKQEGFGRIVNISSIAARGGGVVGPHYAASKAGMLGLTRYSARELGPFGITVNAIAPAFIEDAGNFTGWTDTEKDSLRNKTIVNGLGSSEDVVRAFKYLLDTPFVTGVTLDVNGGAFMI